MIPASSATERAAYFCPGRVNLIGEHIDYNGGLVLPAAISLGITAQIESNGSDIIVLHSDHSPEEVRLPLHALRAHPGHWSDYVIGVLMELQRNGTPLKGCDVRLSSTLPQGSGLSSSAAIEVLTYFMFHHFHTGTEPDRKAMAVACQQVENRHIGVHCGIMDQYAVAMGRKDHAVLLNCDTLESTPVPIRLRAHTLLIINSHAPRSLASSAYNERRAECDRALTILREARLMHHLTEATMSEAEGLTDDVLRKRARHVVSEQLRVEQAVAALRADDLDAFGRLLNASHASLRDDYEVSSPPLDHIVDAARHHPGCLGARLTGAGFGGCCIALMENASVEAFCSSLEQRYHDAFCLPVSFHPCHIADGVGSIG